VEGATGWLEARRLEVEAHEAVTMDYDWTYTSDYSGDAAARGGGPVSWGPSSGGMDRALLTSRDPILYFDDVPLYESELEDHGTAQVGVKVPSGRRSSRDSLAWGES
jgi:type 2A phosphatase activator TIP41